MLGDCNWKQQMFYKILIYVLFIWKMSHKCLLPSKLTKYNELTNWICSVRFRLLVSLFPFLVKFLFMQPLCAFISLRNDPFRGCLLSRCKSSKVPKVCSRSLGSEPLKSQQSRLFALRNLLFRSVKGPKSAKRKILWLWKNRENFPVLWMINI